MPLILVCTIYVGQSLSCDILYCNAVCVRGVFINLPAILYGRVACGWGDCNRRAGCYPAIKIAPGQTYCADAHQYAEI